MSKKRKRVTGVLFMVMMVTFTMGYSDSACMKKCSDKCAEFYKGNMAKQEACMVGCGFGCGVAE